MAYVIGLIINAIVATPLAGLIALGAAALPAKNRRIRARLIRGTVAFVVAWSAIMLFGLIEIFRTHHKVLSEADGAHVIPGLVDSPDQVLRAERVYSGDSA